MVIVLFKFLVHLSKMSFKHLPYIFLSINSSHLVSFVLLGICYYLYRVHKHMDAFPATKRNLFLGNFFDFTDKKSILKNMREYTLTVGKVVRVGVGPIKPSLLTVDPKLIQFISTGNKYVTKGRFYEFFHNWLGSGLITSHGAKWKSRRRALTASFSQSSILQNFIEVFESQGNILIQVLRNEVGKGSIDLHPILKRFTIDVIAECALGVPINTQINKNSEYADNVDIVQGTAILRMASLFKRYDFLYQFTSDCKKERNAINVLDRFLDDILAKKRRNSIIPHEAMIDNQPQAVLDLLLNMKIDGKHLTRNDIREEINSIIFAGYDTTATSISCTLYEVAKYPDIQDKIFQEQKSIFGDNIKNSKSTFEDITKMEYLDLVVRESLRMYPPVPVVAKRVSRGLTYEGDIVLAEGLNVVNFIYGVHLHPEHFHDPEKFIPERFRDETILPNTYMPFSLGPRQCIGKRFANLEMKCTLSKIFRNFRVHPVAGHKLQLIPYITLVSQTGFCVSLEKI